VFSVVLAVCIGNRNLTNEDDAKLYCSVISMHSSIRGVPTSLYFYERGASLRRILQMCSTHPVKLIMTRLFPDRAIKGKTTKKASMIIMDVSPSF